MPSQSIAELSSVRQCNKVQISIVFAAKCLYDFQPNCTSNASTSLTFFQYCIHFGPPSTTCNEFAAKQKIRFTPHNAQSTRCKWRKLKLFSEYRQYHNGDPLNTRIERTTVITLFVRSSHCHLFTCHSMGASETSISHASNGMRATVIARTLCERDEYDRSREYYVRLASAESSTKLLPSNRMPDNVEN